MKTFAVFIALCLAVTYGYVMIEPSSPGTPQNKCLSKTHALGVMTNGEEKQVPQACMMARCMGKGHISYEGCGSVGLPANCKFVEPDPNAPFPKCCKYDFICP